MREYIGNRPEISEKLDENYKCNYLNFAMRADDATFAVTFAMVRNISTIKSIAMRMPIPSTGRPREI